MRFIFKHLCLITLILVSIIFSGLNHASAATVSGTIYAESLLQANATVTLTEAVSSIQTGTTHSNDNGIYSFANINNGTYNLTVVPPPGSLFQSTAIHNIIVNNSDVTQDVTMLKTFSLSGTVKNVEGVSVSNVTVSVYNQSGTVPVSSKVTNVNGEYSFQLPASGTYKLSLKRDNTSGVSTIPLPASFSITFLAQNIVVDGPVTKDLTLPPFVMLGGKTTDRDGIAVPFASMSIHNKSWTADGANYTCSNSATSDASGSYAITLLPYALYSVTVTPPANNKSVLTTTIDPLDASVTATRDIQLKPAVSVSGTVKSQQGMGVSNITVYLYNQSNSAFIASRITDSNGTYSFTGLAVGTYKFSLGKFNSTSNIPLPTSFSISFIATNIAVEGTATKDFILPAFVVMNGKTTDTNGVTVPSVSMSVANASWTETNGAIYTCSNSGTSDVSGNYTMTLLPYSNYVITLNPPSTNKNVYKTTIDPLDALITNTRNLQLLPAYSISGTVRSQEGVNASNIKVHVYDQSGSSPLLSTYTDANGAYSFILPAGTYKLSMEVPPTFKSNIPLPTSFSVKYAANNIVVAGAVIKNLTLPAFVTVTGRTVDMNGVVIPAVAMSVAEATWAEGGVVHTCRNHVTSDASGNYTMTLLPYSSYSITLTPPASNTSVITTTINPLNASVSATKDLKLTLKPTVYSISGTVKNVEGVGASGITVSVYDQSATSSLVSTVTDINGAYSFTLPSGTYKVSLKRGTSNASSNLPLPTSFAVKYVASNIVVTGDVTKDLTLPAFITLNGRTVDTDNAVVVPAVTMSVAEATWTDGGIIYTSSNSGASDASGNYTMTLLPYSSYAITLTPPASNTTVITTTINPLDATVTTTKDLKLKNKSAYSISGTVKSAKGVNASNITVAVYDQSASSPLSTTVTDANGVYYSSVPAAGTYKLALKKDSNTPASNITLPDSFSVTYIASNIVTDGVVTKDLTLPAFVTLSGKTTNNDGVAVPAIKISINQPVPPLHVIPGWTKDGIYYTCSTTVTSDASGNYTMPLLPHSAYSLKLEPPSEYSTITLYPYSVVTDTLHNIILNKIDTFRLNAVVSGTNGSITSTPSGISCNSGNCSWNFNTGTAVTLTATAPGFKGWSGACSGTLLSCDVTMNAELTVTATYDDTTPPSLTISSLKDGAYTNNATLNVAGKVIDDTAVSVFTINGIPVDISTKDGSFSHAVTLLPGTNTITIVASDAANHNTTDTRSIILDNTSPKLTLSGPEDNITTTSSNVIVSGSVDEMTTVDISVNGGSALSAVINANTFSENISLSFGLNTIDILAKDLAGNTSSAKRTIIYDNLKPALAITVPSQDIRSSKTALTIRGTVADFTKTTVSITMDGENYAPVVTNGAFSQPLSFTSFKTYPITVIATDEVGNSSMVQRNIIHTEPNIMTAADALKALKIVVGATTATSSDITNYDVAPLVNGLPAPDGSIDIGDIIVIMENIVGLITW